MSDINEKTLLNDVGLLKIDFNQLVDSCIIYDTINKNVGENKTLKIVEHCDFGEKRDLGVFFNDLHKHFYIYRYIHTFLFTYL